MNQKFKLVTRKRNLEARIGAFAEIILPTDGVPMPQRVMAVPSDCLIAPNLGVGMYLQEVFNIYVYAQPDRQPLCATGLDWRLVEELPARMELLRWAEARWYVARYSATPSEMQYRQSLEKARQLHEELVHFMNFACRRDVDLMRAIRELADCSNETKFFSRGLSLTMLAHENTPGLQAIGFQTSRIDELKNLFEELPCLLANIEGEKGETDRLRVTRDKAYTFLYAAVEELRRCARHAFWNDKRHLRGYAIEYFRKSSRKPKDTAS